MKTVLKYKFWYLVLSSIIFLSLFFVSCQSIQRTSKIASSINAELSFSSPPNLNTDTTLTFQVKQRVFDSPNTLVEFTLPDEFKVMSGDTKWQGPMTIGETKEFKLKVRAMKTGTHIIQAKAATLTTAGLLIESNGDILYVTVTNLGAIVSRVPPFTFVPNPGFSYSTRIYTTAEPLRKPTAPNNVTLDFVSPPEFNK